MKLVLVALLLLTGCSKAYYFWGGHRFTKEHMEQWCERSTSKTAAQRQQAGLPMTPEEFKRQHDLCMTEYGWPPEETAKAEP